MITDKNDKIINLMLESESYRMKVQTLIVSFLFGFVGLIMFVINLITHTVNLAIITGIITFVGFSMTIYIIKTNKINFPKFFIAILFFLIIIIFIYTGGIDGFSPYWALLLPVISFFLFGFKSGTYLSIGLFGIIAFMLWTPFINLLQYTYTSTFITRFPILYFGVLVCSFSSEYLRFLSYKRLHSTILELDQLSRYDSLTKLENRRAFKQHLEDIHHIFNNKNNFVTILIIDIDDFKNYNDFYGHLKGDEVLIATAKILKELIERNNGYISRWGGEEFICLLPFVDSAQGKNIAEQLVAAVDASQIIHEKTSLDQKFLSISVGGATASSNHIHDFNDMIEKADKSLYIAKWDGKNRSGPIFSFK